MAFKDGNADEEIIIDRQTDRQTKKEAITPSHGGELWQTFQKLKISSNQRR